ncbi:hypothetical protein AAVH_30156, partial [Aphelenchoides avenae]
TLRAILPTENWTSPIPVKRRKSPVSIQDSIKTVAPTLPGTFLPLGPWVPQSFLLDHL